MVSTAIAVFAGLMWRCEAMHTEYLTGALAKTRAELAEAEARECRSGIVSSRPSQKNAGLSGP